MHVMGSRNLLGVLILADSTGDVKNAITRVSTLLIGYLAPVVVLVLIFLGWQYLLASATDDTHRAAQLKWAILGIIGGVLLVALASSFGADLVSAVTP